jgi:hypothetical protein
MFEEPSEGDDLFGKFSLVREPIDDSGNSGGLIVHLARQKVLSAVSEKSAAQGTPSERGDFLFLTLIQGSILEALELEKTDLDLIDAERKRKGGLQERKLRRPKVTHAEFADFAAIAQGLERLCHFFGMHEVVGAVEMQKVDPIDAETFKG